eukprot:12873682-Prorocentrum_lima.AAC.1
MTSSLVGSEMCIRDSRWKLCGSCCQTWPRVGGLAQAGAAREPERHCLSCLLYTSDAADDM